MEKRKVVYQDGSYQFLKPREDNRFFPWGKRKSFKAVVDAHKDGRFELIMSQEIEVATIEYLRKEEERRRNFIVGNTLEAKTI